MFFFSHVLTCKGSCGFSRECSIYQSCNSVSSPAVWRGNVSLPEAQDIHHLVTMMQRSPSRPGGRGHHCHSAFHWTAGQWFDWWTAVAQSCFCLADWWMVYFFARTRTRWISLQNGQSSIFVCACVFVFVCLCELPNGRMKIFTLVWFVFHLNVILTPIVPV